MELRNFSIYQVARHDFQICLSVVPFDRANSSNSANVRNSTLPIWNRTSVFSPFSLDRRRIEKSTRWPRSRNWNQYTFTITGPFACGVGQMYWIWALLACRQSGSALPEIDACSLRPSLFARSYINHSTVEMWSNIEILKMHASEELQCNIKIRAMKIEYKE